MVALRQFLHGIQKIPHGSLATSASELDNEQWLSRSCKEPEEMYGDEGATLSCFSPIFNEKEERVA
jgi:hypothetical protein